MASIDERELRSIFGTFVTGVTVITCLGPDGLPRGVTANSFSSVSLDPPMVLWSQRLNALSFPAYRDADRFVVNILAVDQIELSQRFSSPAPNRFDGVAFERGIGEIPVLIGCAATLQCARVAIYPGGDHAVFLGRVEYCEKNAKRPLAFSSGRYAAVNELNTA
ncbi:MULTISPECIES: flavin reductase family protein [Polaromonas]|uniref:Flavin reductase family protein n=1 Tax=Polaromonas aquatica TaxID=332657 RepID=A0ABW1U5N1_9BURK